MLYNTLVDCAHNKCNMFQKKAHCLHVFKKTNALISSNID